MRIIEKSGRRSNFVVFQFRDEEDRDFFIDYLNEFSELLIEDDKTEFRELLSKLKSRTDDKYATEKYKLSGLLFHDEFIRFSFIMIILVYQMDLKANVKTRT